MGKATKPATLAGQRASKNSHGRAARQSNYHTKELYNQSLPAPGTALTAFLKKYRDELLVYPQTPEVVRILDLVAPLLALAGGRQ